MPQGKHKNHVRLNNHYRWNNKKMISSHGYVKVRVGRNHPLADPNGYTYEHLLVWCAAGFSRPAQGFILHHKNGDMLDNQINNLELMRRGEHNAHHNEGRVRDSTGRFTMERHDS